MKKNTTPASPAKWTKWLKRIGWGGFLFFLIKGLLWLVVIYWIRKR